MSNVYVQINFEKEHQEICICSCSLAALTHSSCFFLLRLVILNTIHIILNND